MLWDGNTLPHVGYGRLNKAQTVQPFPHMRDREKGNFRRAPTIRLHFPGARRRSAGGDAQSVMEPRTPLQHKGDEPFRAPHILLISLAEMLLQDVLFHMDTVAEAKQRTSHKDQQTQTVRRAEPKSEEHDEQAGRGGMPNESVGTRFDHRLLGYDGHGVSPFFPPDFAGKKWRDPFVRG